ncbi:pentatricopeptide repeat-containing protein At4g02750 [Dendrobium catenatum]|uniref:Pentatricopeptide repeat-containing protein n=1 Tax=Dendrobium catenatum TaxID=906689 RepID=A0A2I0VN18_9ASPA|nr:pentatricopeptide repeat-containing protein At4g02750 [Dendrobium catenatum]PKU64790.1 Pentatricopeptide repeat-containing protein [Dendrobium catenatum]
MLPRLLLHERFISFNSSFENLFFKITPSIRRFSSSSDAAPARRDIFWWNSAIMRCFRNGEVEHACKMFEEMPHRNIVTWNCMITGYVKNFRLVDAQSIFDLMPHRNVVSYAALMTGYLQDGRVEEARNLFDNIPERNVVCWNSLISGYISNGRIREARKLFDNMPSRNSVSWCIMVSGYIHQKKLDQAFNLFKQSPFHPTTLCNALLSGYIDLGCLKEAEYLFARMESRDAVSWNSMITCYSRAGNMELAQQLFNEMPEKDVISWTAIIRGHLQNGNVNHASRLFEEMPSRDVMSWNTMVGGFVQNGLLDDALNLFDKMPNRDIVSWNTILQGFVHNNDVVNARRWFENMPQRSETSWNTLISGYQTIEALGLFCDMVKEGFKPDQVTLVIVISVCGSLVALGWGRMLHLYVIRAGYEHDILVTSSLISMYSRCGFVEDSSNVFHSMSKRDTIAWNAMISTYAYHGFAKEAIELYKKMIQSNFHPDHATFLNLLLACSHKGLIDEGFRYFISMKEEWKLAPRAEHYSCLVDLLGRHGFIDQAYKLTEKVPEDVQTNSWETLLSACQVHQHLEVGELTAKRVFDKKHSDGGMHVLLSNIYAAKGKWSEASQIRALMREQGLKKETGCTWIEVKGKIFYFVSNDRSHPQVEQICRELDSIFFMLEGIC